MRKTLLAALPLAFATTALAATPAHADDRRCANATLGAGSVAGSVIVPRGTHCTLNGTRVDGDVKVGAGARVYLKGARIDGNVQGQNARWIGTTVRTVNGTTLRTVVCGNIQAEQGVGGSLLHTVVRGDIQVFSNRGSFKIARNVVDGNLQCKSNSPAPTGYGNRVEGDKENQCRGM